MAVVPIFVDCINFLIYSNCNWFFLFSADEAYREGDIRLVGGAYNWEGRVDIYWKGSWGTISDTSWTSQDAIVVCRQLQHYFGSGKCYNHFHRLKIGHKYYNNSSRIPFWAYDKKKFIRDRVLSRL